MPLSFCILCRILTRLCRKRHQSIPCDRQGGTEAAHHRRNHLPCPLPALPLPLCCHNRGLLPNQWEMEKWQLVGPPAPAAPVARHPLPGDIIQLWSGAARAGVGPSCGVSRGGKGPPGPQHCACCGGGLLRELVPVERDEHSGSNCGCPFHQPFPGNLPGRPQRECSPCVCRISTAVCAPLLIRLHNTPCASCPAAGPGDGMVPGSTAGLPGPPQTS